jgi:hypothetical protein
VRRRHKGRATLTFCVVSGQSQAPERNRVLPLDLQQASAMMKLGVRRYPDWRYRYIRDRAGVAIWVGPYGVYFWRMRDTAGMRRSIR